MTQQQQNTCNCAICATRTAVRQERKRQQRQCVVALLATLLGLALIPHTPPPYAAMDWLKCRVIECPETPPFSEKELIG